MWQWFRGKINGGQSVGRLGEEAAARQLVSLGHQIIERNYRNRRGRQLGEIDIVSQDGEWLVFSEVKTRVCQASDGTLPQEQITPAKLRRMERTAAEYLRQHRLEDAPYRFDGLAVRLRPDRSIERIDYLPNLYF